MTLIADLCRKLPTLKNLVRQMPKKSSFRWSIVKQHGKRAKTLLKFERQQLYHIYWLLWRQLNCKMSLLVLWKISRLFSSTLSADTKYSLLNKDNFTQQIKMQLCQKQKNFSEFFSAFLKSSLNFELFQKEMTLMADLCWKLRTPRKPS